MFSIRKYISVILHSNEDKEVERDKSGNVKEQKAHPVKITYLKYKCTSFIINFTHGLEIY